MYVFVSKFLISLNESSFQMLHLVFEGTEKLENLKKNYFLDFGKGKKICVSEKEKRGYKQGQKYVLCMLYCS